MTSSFYIGYRLLHFSWLCVVMRRAFVHESKTIIKWAVTDFLTMPMDNSPLKQQEFWPVCEVFYQAWGQVATFENTLQVLWSFIKYKSGKNQKVLKCKVQVLSNVYVKVLKYKYYNT